MCLVDLERRGVCAGNTQEEQREKVTDEEFALDDGRDRGETTWYPELDYRTS